jgi:glycosyltransferase involved in cell wall biosynthesis
MRVAVLTSHPIQYQAPWFRGLAKRVDLEVFFAHRQSAAEQGKAGFGVAFDWDVDLLSGYKHRFLANVSRNPGVDHFAGCDTPEVKDIIAGTTGPRNHGTTGQLSTDHGPRTTERFDAFIVSGWHLKSYWQAVRACRRAGVPVLVRGDSQLHTPRSRLRRWAKEIVYPPLLRQFDGLLVVGKRNREYLAHYGVPPEKMFFVPHFVDNEWFKGKAEMARKQKAEIRRQWGASERSMVALFVGKFQPIKRPADLLKAMAQIRAQKVEGGGHNSADTDGLVAVFVGAGELDNELRDLAVRENLRAHFAGFKNQSELPACYASADVLVLPSESETWGLVVNEAMACGLPAIVSAAVGCAPDLIEEGKTGFSYPASDCAALARCLQQLAVKKRRNFDFPTHIRAKADTYSVRTAVAGTLGAVSQTVRIRN